jgi:hypothetical protein
MASGLNAQTEFTCAYDSIMESIYQNPIDSNFHNMQYQQLQEKREEIQNSESEIPENFRLNKNGSLVKAKYIIPVVVHVCHKVRCIIIDLS